MVFSALAGPKAKAGEAEGAPAFASIGGVTLKPGAGGLAGALAAEQSKLAIDVAASNGARARLTLDWPFAPGWSLLVRGNNVFDKNYELSADFSTGGATVFAGVKCPRS